LGRFSAKKDFEEEQKVDVVVAVLCFLFFAVAGYALSRLLAL